MYATLGMMVIRWPAKCSRSVRQAHSYDNGCAYICMRRIIPLHFRCDECEMFYMLGIRTNASGIRPQPLPRRAIYFAQNGLLPFFQIARAILSFLSFRIMSEIESQLVHRGVWSDVSRGTFLGRTITTDVRTGTFLIAIMAVLCSLGTTHLWHLVTFGIHQYRANGKPNDALYSQQQAILRTFPSPTAVLTEHAKLYMAWRRTKSHSPARRLVTIITLAAVFAGATVLTGIFSSLVVDTTNLQVIVDSPSCGPLDWYKDKAAFAISTTFLPSVRSLAEPIVRGCYEELAATSPQCRIYLKPRIPFNVTRQNCPWNSTLCLNMDRPAVTMDSGLLDVNDAFGLNLASVDRVMYRKKTTCAILPVENHASVIPAAGVPEYKPTADPGEEALIISYGNSPGNDTSRNQTFVFQINDLKISRSSFEIG